MKEVNKTRNQDWTGNANSIFKTLGASNHTNEERQSEDYYATTPRAAELLLEIETFSPYVWECACGQGHMSEIFSNAGYTTTSTDLIDRGYGSAGVDFLSPEITEWNGDIITNPPYRYGQEFVEKALTIIPEGKKVAMFLKLQFMESKKRKNLFLKHPPKTIHVSSSRLMCAKNGEFDRMEQGGGSAVAYAWYIWEKGYTGDTTIKWFN